MASLYQYYKQLKMNRQKKDIPLYVRLFLPAIGLLALVWFLIRVIPKPSRAGYPCQRIAFPLASSFVIWLAGLLGSLVFIHKARRHLAGLRYWLAALCIAVSVICLWFTISITSSRQVRADDPVPNNPIGVAQGIYPGRVVWIHDPNATDWDGSGTADGYSWQPVNTSQKYVDAMVSKAIRELSGCATDAQAWDAMFRHFNNLHGKPDTGYMPGEKITIKINLTTCNANNDWVNPATYEKTTYLDRSDTNPQMILSVLRQLVCVAGVEPNCIAVGDTLARFPNQWRDLLYPEFPTVVYFDKIGGSGRTQSTPSTIVQHWSHGLNPESFATDYIPLLYAQADYLINMAVLKSHGAGITLCAKNHYGSYNRTPDETGYYDLHPSLAYNNPETEQYRALVDIIGHPDMGAKTLLYMLDGLYGGDNWSAMPIQFQMDPFNDDWPSSIFVSQDPVAIDSVGLDILWTEGWSRVLEAGGIDDYLKEAAQANDPPSGTFYDPDGDGIALESLGVYERWNNAIDRQYSRNLSSGNGIELCYSRIRHLPGDINSDNSVGMEDLAWLIEQWLWTGNAGQTPEDIIEDGVVNLLDFEVLAANWSN
jgi:hypothetical protein